MSDLNKKNINYGALNRFYQDLKSHDISTLNDRIDNIDIPEYVAGNNIQINGNVISATDTIYTLPTASSNTKGGVKVGAGLSISNEVLSTIVTPEFLIKLLLNQDLLNPLTFEATEDNTEITFNGSSINIETSKDGKNWTQYSASNGGTLVGTLNTGEKLFVRGENSSYNGRNFLFNKNAYVYGNIMSLIDKNNYPIIYNLTADSTFYGLFKSNTHLLSHQTKKLCLPATTLTRLCYGDMFYGCTNLTTAPELPATTLVYGCYSRIFYGCTSLTTAPDLSATTLADYCYQSMFQDCTNLNYIKCLATNISARDCTAGWVYKVASSGLFVKHPNMQSWTIGINGIPNGWVSEVEYQPTLQFTPSGAIELLVHENNALIGVTKLSTYQTLYISKDGENWMLLPNVSAISVNSGETVYMCGTLTGNNTNTKYTNLFISGNTEASGNINALWDYTNLDTPLKQYCGYKLFYNCAGLVGASGLTLGTSATTLASNCYNHMFAGCTSLTEAPELPATTLADDCYYMMFAGCTSLTEAPELPATTLANNCYEYMFNYCSSLTTAPVLPATTLTSGCYGDMFRGCTSLTTAPELPATTLAQSCYQYMFAGCTSLTEAPELPATTLANNCYEYMFDGCTNLNYIKCLATDISASDCTRYWLNGVSSTGTFVKNSNMAGWTTGNNGIPSGWTVQDYVAPQTVL